MRVYNIPDKVNGEQDLAREILKILPLIEKHFKPLDGERVLLKSGGYSAKLNKVKAAFYADCEQVSDARIIVNAKYSMRIDIDIHRPLSDSEGCAYYESSVYCGTIDNSFSDPTGVYKYEYRQSEKADYCEQIISTTVEQLKQARAKIDEHKKAIDRLEQSAPYVFIEILRD